MKPLLTKVDGRQAKGLELPSTTNAALGAPVSITRTSIPIFAKSLIYKYFSTRSFKASLMRRKAFRQYPALLLAIHLNRRKS
jgi:hypothetical protein